MRIGTGTESEKLVVEQAYRNSPVHGEDRRWNGRVRMHWSGHSSVLE